MSSEVDILIEMGFAKEKVERALRETDHKGIEPAMEWLLMQPSDVEKADDDGGKPAEENIQSEKSVETETETETETSEAAQSLKCEDCGKLFPGIPEAEFHATKSGHSNFTESTDEVKPLNDEEKQAQLLRVQEMLKQRRKEREEKEKQEQLERERARRVIGKEMSQTKQKYEEQELKKAIDERKREKEEEKMARQRVRDQIEKDKRDREAKFAPVSPSSSSAQQQQQPTPAAATVATTTRAVKKEYPETKIQIRLLDGDKMTETFNVKETLAAVRFYVQQNSSRYASIPFTFTSSFPWKEYDDDDMQTPLEVLGLVPSAVLMVKKLGTLPVVP